MRLIKLLRNIVKDRSMTRRKAQQKSPLQIAIETELARLKREHTPLVHTHRPTRERSPLYSQRIITNAQDNRYSSG